MPETQEIKIISLDRLTFYDSLMKTYIGSKLFVGTTEEYKTAYANGEISIGAIVVLTDDETSGEGSSGGDSTSSTTAMLGYAVLGQMILG